MASACGPCPGSGRGEAYPGVHYGALARGGAIRGATSTVPHWHDAIVAPALPMEPPPRSHGVTGGATGLGPAIVAARHASTKWPRELLRGARWGRPIYTGGLSEISKAKKASSIQN